MKLGTEENSVVAARTSLSGHRPRPIAAAQPSRTPSPRASAAAMPPIFADAPNDSPTIAEISRPVLSEMPKSPRMKPLRYSTNCSPAGRSRWNLDSSAARTAGSGAFSEANGPPGMACMAKNVIAATANTVPIADSARLTAYPSMLSPLPREQHSYITLIISQSRAGGNAEGATIRS